LKPSVETLDIVSRVNRWAGRSDERLRAAGTWQLSIPARPEPLS